MPALIDRIDAHLARGGKAGLSFSGGKDSLALLYLMRADLHRITVYHLDTGDLMPELRASAAHAQAWVPYFVRITGDVERSWRDNGLPTDLWPYGSHPIGALAGQTPTVGGEPVKLIPRYACCSVNLMLPIWERMKADGVTLVLRGTKRSDMERLPFDDGMTYDGMELALPIREWSDADVLAYLRGVGAPHNPIYDHMQRSPECARCTAWWGEGRGAYLRLHHPDLWVDYSRRLRLVAGTLDPSLAELRRELFET